MSFQLTFEPFPQPDGPLRYAPVPWDSEVYGFPFYELRGADTSPEVLSQHLSPWLSSLPTDQPCLVYSKIPTRAVAQAQVLTAHGFYPVETIAEISLPLARIIPLAARRPGQGQLRQARETDLPQVIAIARSAFSNDRLHLDPNLSPEKANERYGQWVERGFDASEPIFVYEDRRTGQVIGFFHIREIAPKTIDLSLAAVSRAYQGSGLGALMYEAVLTECQARGYQTAITRITINNLEIINLFARLGFMFRAAVLTLHWFRPTREKENHDR